MWGLDKDRQMLQVMVRSRLSRYILYLQKNFTILCFRHPQEYLVELLSIVLETLLVCFKEFVLRLLSC